VSRPCHHRVLRRLRILVLPQGEEGPCGSEEYPSRLRQILNKLLGSAVKFAESGEVVLCAEGGPSDQIQFAVSDTGIGIPSDKLQTIFDDFTQADTSTTRKNGGAGLGIGHRLLEAMGGRLTASNSTGKGGAFRSTARVEPAPEKDGNRRVAIGDPQDGRVLLTDDSSTSCLILRETLSTWGLESDACQSPAKELAGLPGAMAGGQLYSLVAIDSCMPGINGFESAIEIRRIASSEPILLTSDARAGDTLRRVESWMSGYAVNPQHAPTCFASSATLWNR